MVTKAKLDAFIDAMSVDLLADMEEDFDNAAKAKRLHAKARKIREAAGITEDEMREALATVKK